MHDYVNANGRGLADAADAATGWVADPAFFPYYSGDLTKLANVRTIDYLRDAGVTAHSMSYFELAQNHFPTDARAALLAEEGPMTTIHSAPYLSLTHGGLADVAVSPGESEPGEGPGAGEPGAGGPGAGTPGGTDPSAAGGASGGGSVGGPVGGSAGAPAPGSAAGAARMLVASGGEVSSAPIVLAVAMTLLGFVLVATRARRRSISIRD